MALLPTNQRDQIKAATAIAAIALIVAYYMLVWSPKRDTLLVQQTRVDSLQAMNRQVKAEASRGSVKQLKAQARLYAEDLESMRHLVPTGNEVPALLDEISTAARHAGLDISDVVPEGVTPGDQFDTYRYKIGVTGPYHQVGQFLANVGSLQRIVAPINLSLLPASQASRRKDQALLDAKFEIQTYVAHTSTVSPAATLAPAGAQ